MLTRYITRRPLLNPHLAIGQLVRLLDGGGGGGGGHLLLKVEGDVAKLLLDVADNLALGGRDERISGTEWIFRCLCIEECVIHCVADGPCVRPSVAHSVGAIRFSKYFCPKLMVKPKLKRVS